jgi:checkpoint serine/threonine-protein kinase
VDLKAAAKPGTDPMDVRLEGEASEEDMACVAMRKGLSWSFDADTFGICASAHVLLYGTHIDIDYNPSTKRWKPRKPLRRYWQKDLWNEFFDTLLNLDELSQTALGSRPGSLRDLRKKFEAHVRGRSSELESLLRHQDRVLPSSRIK